MTDDETINGKESQSYGSTSIPAGLSTFFQFDLSDAFDLGFYSADEIESVSFTLTIQNRDTSESVTTDTITLDLS